MNNVSRFKNLKLDREEQRVEKALVRGDFVSVSNFKKSKKLFAEAAKNYQRLQKSKPITIRLNQQDLLRIKVKAKKNRIPYQTLLSTLIHQYAKGQTQIEL